MKESQWEGRSPEERRGRKWRREKFLSDWPTEVFWPHHRFDNWSTQPKLPPCKQSKEFLKISKIDHKKHLNSLACGLSLWRLQAVKSIKWEAVQLNELHIFFFTILNLVFTTFIRVKIFEKQFLGKISLSDAEI